MSVKTYDPKQVSISVGGFNLTGFADGTFITVARDEPAWSTQIGTDGEGTRSKSNNKSGTITVNLMQSSASNQILSAIAAADEFGNAGITNVFIKDNSGLSLYQAESAWIEKYPDSEFGREAAGREWVMKTDNLLPFVGGNS